MVPEEDEVKKRFKRRTAETKELFGEGKTDKVRSIQYEKTLSVCEEIALELNKCSRRPWQSLQEIANLSTARPLVTGWKALHLNQQLHYQNYFKAGKTTKSIP